MGRALMALAFSVFVVLALPVAANEKPTDAYQKAMRDNGAALQEIRAAAKVSARCLRRTSLLLRASDDARWADAKCTTQNALAGQDARRMLFRRRGPLLSQCPG